MRRLLHGRGRNGHPPALPLSSSSSSSTSTLSTSSSVNKLCNSSCLVSVSSFLAGALTFVLLSNVLQFHSLILVGSMNHNNNVADSSKVPSIQVWLSSSSSSAQHHDDNKNKNMDKRPMTTTTKVIDTGKRPKPRKRQRPKQVNPNIAASLAPKASMTSDNNNKINQYENRNNNNIIRDNKVNNQVTSVIVDHDIVDHDKKDDHEERLVWPLAPDEFRLFFIHVGKAGGMSLNTKLKVLDQTRKFLSCRMQYQTPDDFLQDACRQTPGAAAVARLTLRIYGHMHRSYPENKQTEQWLVENTNVLLFTVRDPIDRITSAFNYARYMIFEFTGGRPNKKYHPTALEFYNKCFANMDECAAALDPRNTTTPAHPCRDMALPIVQGQTQIPDLDHLYYNYGHYARRAFPASHGNVLSSAFDVSKSSNHGQSQKPTPASPAVLVIRTEHMWEDTARLEAWAGGQAERFLTPETLQFKLSHGSETFAVNKGISDAHAVAMCCVLAEDIQVYQDLIVVAMNLKQSEKMATLQALWRRCFVAKSDNDDAPSWNQLSKFSWQKWAQETCHAYRPKEA